MNPRGLVVVGASAGGVQALRLFVAGLPVGLEAAVCVVLHIPPGGTSVLPRILGKAGPLPAAAAVDGDPLVAGWIHVAPTDRHLLVSGGLICLSRGPTEHGHRPAVDPLFRSAARVWGGNVIGVVLSGSGDDGTAGLVDVARCGGAALVQDAAEALHPSMPRHAAGQVGAARILPAAAMGTAIRDILDDLPWPAAAVVDRRDGG